MIPIFLLIPVVVSGFLLAAEMVSGGLTRIRAGILAAWFLIAAYLQFRGGSIVLSLAGLLAQVVLALYLRLRAILPGE